MKTSCRKNNSNLSSGISSWEEDSGSQNWDGIWQTKKSSQGGRIAASLVNYRQHNAVEGGKVGDRVGLIAPTMQNSELLALQWPSAPTSSSVLCDHILTQTVEGTVFIRLCLRPCPFHRRSIVDNTFFIGLQVYASHPYWRTVLNALLLRNNGSWPAALMSTFYQTFLKQEQDQFCESAQYHFIPFWTMQKTPNMQ